jgi:pimeloyl-ACP methyl ester carboxylesterase
MVTHANVPAPAAWRPSTMVMPAGERIAIFEAGVAGSDAPVVVLVHGLGHWAGAAWDALAARFAGTHRIVAFDLPGFGESDKPDVAYTLAYFTDVLARVVACTRATAGPVADGTFALVGHSLGGLVAANYAARYPQQVRALALLDPAGFLRTPKIVLRVAGSGPVSWLFRTIKPSPGFIESTLDQSVYDPRSVSPEVRARAIELSQDPALTRAFARVYSGAMQEMLHMRALHRFFATWSGPTLLVWGKDDRYVPFAGLAHARTVYPQARILAIEHCGHCPAIEYPELVTRALRAIGA